MAMVVIIMSGSCYLQNVTPFFFLWTRVNGDLKSLLFVFFFALFVFMVDYYRVLGKYQNFNSYHFRFLKRNRYFYFLSQQYVIDVRILFIDGQWPFLKMFDW